MMGHLNKSLFTSAGCKLEREAMLSPPDTQADLCQSVTTMVTLQPERCCIPAGCGLIINASYFCSHSSTEHGDTERDQVAA